MHISLTDLPKLAWNNLAWVLAGQSNVLIYLYQLKVFYLPADAAQLFH